VSDAAVIALHALRGAARRRVLLVVALLTVGFLALYALAAFQVFASLEDDEPFGRPISVDDRALAGGTLLGLSMFVTLFLGVVLAVFLTLDAVRGDAERGLLQPLVVRPVGRTALLLGRLAGAAGVCVPYVVVVFAISVVLTRAAGDFTPSSVVIPAAALALGVVTIVALSLLGSTVLSSTATSRGSPRRPASVPDSAWPPPRIVMTLTKSFDTVLLMPRTSTPRSRAMLSALTYETGSSLIWPSMPFTADNSVILLS